MIYCFSGTGNTLHVAKMLAPRIGHELTVFDADDLRNPSEAKLQCDDRLIVWAFPTYSWGVPPVVRNLIREASLQFPEGSLHIAVTTCGDDIGNLAKMFRRAISDRGYNAGAVFSVAMPNTYVMMKGFETDPETLARQKIEASQKRVDHISRAILDGHTSPSDDITVKGGFAAFKTGVIYPWFVRFDMSPRGFNVDKTLCLRCGRCGKVCPMRNIDFDTEHHPVWGDKCAFCTACYHVCPVHAINWKRTTLKKGQVRYFSNEQTV